MYAAGRDADVPRNTQVLRTDGNLRIVGHNLDGDGFVGGLLREKGANAVRNKRCLLVGAGGAARAIAHGLLTAGAADVAVVNRTRVRAVALCNAVNGARALDAMPSKLSDVDVLVQRAG